MKTCYRCKEDKPLSEFYKHHTNSDGYNGQCKRCFVGHQRARRQTQEGKAYKAALQKAWVKNNQHKIRAHKAVYNAVKKGELIRQPCMICGATENIHAHHDNYNRKLDVVWLCGKHHSERHLSLDKKRAA